MAVQGPVVFKKPNFVINYQWGYTGMKKINCHSNILLCEWGTQEVYKKNEKQKRKKTKDKKFEN